MNTIFKSIKPILIIASVIILFIIVIFITINKMTFKVVSSNPSNGSTVSSTISELVISFNKKIDPNQNLLEKIKTDPIEIGYRSVFLDKNKIIIQLQNISVNKTYNFTLSDIQSTDGMTIDNHSIVFKTEYVPFSKLSKEEQERATRTEESPTLSSDPIFSITPYETTQYKIDATLLSIAGESNEEKIIIKIHIKSNIGNYEIQQAKNGAINYLKSSGINDLKKYGIEYTVEDRPGRAE